MNVLDGLRHPDRIVSLIVIVFSAVMYALIGGLEEPYGPGALSASDYPRLVLICTVITAVLLILRPHQSVVTSAPVSLRGIPVIVVMAIYIALLEPVGFFILTPVLLFVLPIMAGYRDYLKILLAVFVVTLALYGIFIETLNIPLPAGLLGE